MTSGIFLENKLFYMKCIGKYLNSAERILTCECIHEWTKYENNTNLMFSHSVKSNKVRINIKLYNEVTTY
jgi:hypothetical protein